MHPKTNKFPSCVLANTGWAAGLMWQIKASTNDFLTLIYKYSKKRPGLVCPGRKCFRGTTCIQSLALHFVSTDILCSCNVELTLKPTGYVWIYCWVHCSRATSTACSWKLAPTAFSLCFAELCTPPCHCIWRLSIDCCLLVIIIHLEVLHCQVWIFYPKIVLRSSSGVVTGAML